MQNKDCCNLRTCPFCGGEAVIRESFGTLYIRPIHKENCAVKPDTWLIASKMPLKKQIEAWNRRVNENECESK